MADAAKRNKLSLGVRIERIAAYRQLQGVTVRVNNKERFFDWTRRGILDGAMEFNFSLFCRTAGGIQRVHRDFEPVNNSLQRPCRFGGNREILQGDAPATVVRQCIKNNLRHFAIEPAEIQICEVIDLSSHERTPEPMRAA